MGDKRDLKGLNGYLRERIIGQDDAIARLAQALAASECELNERGQRPRGAFLLMGPSGVGKTESTKAFTEYLFGADRLAMFFMNEMQSAADVDDLVTGIKRATSKHPEGSTLLFDEIEKAHKAIVDVFLSLLDEGQVTDSIGERTSIRNYYVVLTSNIGANRWGQMEQTLYSRMEAFAFEQARKFLRPELFNRLTETIVYRPLSQETQIAILDQALSRKLAHISARLGQIEIDRKPVHAHLLRKCFTQVGGARRLKQELDRQINAAVLPWALDRQWPPKAKLCYNPGKDTLEVQPWVY
jgi:ATP-dependent Clp protease ATP-binding subunit ClpB